MKSIYLIGFMGSGKTTVGKLLAEKLEKTFIDLDEEIVKYTKISIPQFFEQYGEDEFRKVELKLLKDLPIENLIISTGGGIIVREENIQFMLDNGELFYLETEIEEVYQRIHTDTNRPNAVNKTVDDLQRLFLSRKEFYEKAEYIIKTENKTPTEVSEEIIGCLKIGKGGDSRDKS